MKILLWILSKIYPVYWEVTKWGYNCSNVLHFLTEKEAIDYCKKQAGDCIVDKYINCKPVCLIQDNRFHRLVAVENK